MAMAGEPGRGADDPTKCPRVAKWFRGCRWEPRFDRQGPDSALSGKADRAWSIPASWAEHLQVRTTYVRDVCRTCGAVIERGYDP